MKKITDYTLPELKELYMADIEEFDHYEFGKWLAESFERNDKENELMIDELDSRNKMFKDSMKLLKRLTT